MPIIKFYTTKAKNYIKYSYLCLMLSAFLYMGGLLVRSIFPKFLFSRTQDPTSFSKLPTQNCPWPFFSMSGIDYRVGLIFLAQIWAHDDEFHAWFIV